MQFPESKFEKYGSKNIISMIKKFNIYVNKIPMTGINNLRIEMEKKFIN